MGRCGRFESARAEYSSHPRLRGSLYTHPSMAFREGGGPPRAQGEHVGRSTAERLSRNAVTVWDLAAAILPVGLVLLSLLCLVGDSYNPFLYYRF